MEASCSCRPVCPCLPFEMASMETRVDKDMTSFYVCKHCKSRYRRRKGQNFGREFCSMRCYWNGQKISVEAIWARDHGICHLCGNWCPLSEASRDHVKARHFGGKTTWGNIRLAHRECNSRRGHRDVAEYVAWWEKALLDRERQGNE